MATIAPTTGIVWFAELVAKVMTTEPYASARRVFWVVDNGSSHNGRRSVVRMTEAWPTATLVHLPVHASWLNQIEIIFSVIQRKVVNPATSPTSTCWRNVSSRSRPATTAPPGLSTGPSPESSSSSCANASTPTSPLGRRPSPRDGKDDGDGGAAPFDQDQPQPAPRRPRPDPLAAAVAVAVRFRGPFAYIDGHLHDGERLALCRLRYGGSASQWGFAIYRASHNDYENNFLPSGHTAGSPEEALDCACHLYIGGPSTHHRRTNDDAHWYPGGASNGPRLTRHRRPGGPCVQCACGP